VQIMTILMILESHLSGNDGLFCCLYMSCPLLLLLLFELAFVCVVVSVFPLYAGMKASFCFIMAIPCCCG
jgi:hypothetical protein